MTARLALITGASSGIGAALAQAYAAHGYDVALTARREDRLRAIGERIRFQHGVETLLIPADLADQEAPSEIMARIAEQGRHIDVLVNNAGYGLPGEFGEQAWAEEAMFLRVMLGAVLELTHHALPGMKARRFGRILNVASVAGLIPGGRGSTMYGAVKAALVRFSQGLHMETRGAGVHVSALCPGLTYSEFHDVNNTREAMTARAPPWLWLGADEVAAAGYEAVEANRPVCVPGAPYQAIAALAKLLPDEWVMALMTRRR